MKTGLTIDIPVSDGSTLRGYLATPRQGSGPGLVLLHEIFGITAFMRDCADRYAEEGYVVVVPDLYSRIAPATELDYGEQARATATALRARLDLEQSTGDVAAALDVLRAHPAQTGGVGIVGYSFGGRLACLAAASHRVDCVVAYYPVALEQDGEALQALSCPTVLHLAELDDKLPVTAQAGLRELAQNLSAFQIHGYPGVGHGFANALHPGYDKPSAMMAYSRTLALLRRVLGPVYDLSSLWDKHTEHEFATRDVEATMATMVDEPYVNHVPTMTGGVGHAHLKRFYRYHFVSANPPDTRLIPVSRTVGVDRLVDEMVFCFTHTCEIPWMLPGVEPTGRYVEIPLVAIVNFRGDKLYHEHIYWDQASVLVQIGVLDSSRLPVAGIATAKKLLDEQLPSNELMGQRWIASTEFPL